MMQPFPRKFYYEEQSFMCSHYLIELGKDNKLRLQETSPGMSPLIESSGFFSSPTPKQWQEFEQKFYSLDLEAMAANEPVCDGTWLEIWITFRKRVKLSIHLGDDEKLRPLHLALNPLTKCEEYPRGLFPENKTEINRRLKGFSGRN